MTRSFILLVTFLFWSAATRAQDERLLTLSEVIKLAREQSPAALAAKHNLKSKYWQYRSYRASYLPGLNLSGVLPDFNRSITNNILDSGQETFVTRQQANSSLSMLLNQSIGLTGGEVFVTSSLERIDYLVDTTIVSYLGNPIIIGFRQPLMGYNSFRWEKKIEPLKYEEAKREYLEEMEVVSIAAVDRFFGLFMAQISLEIARINYANNDTLFVIAKGRFNLGKIAENDLLQMELAFLNAKIALAESELDLKIREFELRSFLNIQEGAEIELSAPDVIPSFQVDFGRALQEALKRRKDVIGFDRLLLEAGSSLARARGEHGFNASLFGNYGLTRSAPELNTAFINPDTRQSVRIGIQIPIVDWGEARGKVQTAKSQYQLAETIISQQEESFRKEVYLEVMRFNMQSSQLRIAGKADTIGQKRFFVTKQRYLIGKIDITELNNALREKDMARREYVNALHNFWSNYYLIRKLTLFDFEADKEIAFDSNVLKE